MSKFEIYDKVELNKDMPEYELVEGEACMIMSDIIVDEFYAVSFNFDDVEEELLHDCNGLVPNGKGLFVPEEDLRKRF